MARIPNKSSDLQQRDYAGKAAGNVAFHSIEHDEINLDCDIPAGYSARFTALPYRAMSRIDRQAPS